MADLGLGGGYAAGGGADMLQEILKRKLMEQAQAAQQQQAIAKLAEDARQANMANAVSQRQLGQGDQRIGLEGDRLKQESGQFDRTLGLNRDKLGEDARQFDAGTPLRIANTARTNAETSELQRKPQSEIDQRAFQTGRDKAEYGYRLGEIGAQGKNALAVANVNHPDPAAGAAALAQKNEVQDTANLIDRLANHKALNESVGPIDAAITNTERPTNYGAGTALNALGAVGKFVRTGGHPEDVNDFKAIQNELMGKLQLAQAGKLKGQGQISDKERAMLAQSVTSLSNSTDESTFKAELGRLRSQMERLGATPASGGTIRARDAQGILHEAPAGTPLPQGWTPESR